MKQQTTLRTLAKAYANGKIDKEKYRHDRTAYLESVIAGDVSLPVPEAVALARGDTFNQITIQKSDNSRSLPGDKVEPEKGEIFKQKSTLIFGGIGVAIVLTILALGMSGGDETQPQTQSSQTDDLARNTTVDAPPSAAQNLIARFLEENNWAQSNLDVFLMNWRMTSESERASAANSTEYSRLINAIYKKLLEERALSRIGNPQTSYEKQRQLVEFASTIGISDQRISLPDEPVLNQ